MLKCAVIIIALLTTANLINNHLNSHTVNVLRTLPDNTLKSPPDNISKAPPDTELPRLYRNTSAVLREGYSDELFYYLHLNPISKNLVVHSAYFDDRPRKGHSNTTMIYFTANRTIFLSKWITGCGVGSKEADTFLVQPTYQQAGRSRKFPYEQYLLECFDLPAINGSRAFVTYKTASSMTEHTVVESERGVMMPAPRVQPTGKYNFTVATCTKIFNRKVTYLPEFVRYQRTIGVDHVHLSVLDEFVSDGGFHDIVMKDAFLSEAIRSGYLSITVLKVWYTETETFLYSSVYQRLGCFYRLRGTYDYISIADTDDFFTPRIPGETDIKYYIQEYCTKGTSSAGSCRFEWRWVYPDVCGVTGSVGPDGNVTGTVKISQVEKYHRNTKSIHSSKATVDFSFHDAKCSSCLMPGYKTVDMPPETVYFVHNRLNSKRKEKMCAEQK